MSWWGMKNGAGGASSGGLWWRRMVLPRAWGPCRWPVLRCERTSVCDTANTHTHTHKLNSMKLDHQTGRTVHYHNINQYNRNIIEINEMKSIGIWQCCMCIHQPIRTGVGEINSERPAAGFNQPDRGIRLATCVINARAS